MRKILLTLLLLIAFPVFASHIVGGEFELIHISGNKYRLNLIIYFDQINGALGAKDLGANVSIFRKRDKMLMSTVTLLLQNESNVPYTQPECSNGEIVTTKLLYTSELTLSAAQFNDPEGYFVVWQRCCRNYSISNIYSEMPGGTNTSAGQTFYMEFPPVVKNGEPFINSSPRLFPPLNDFACPFRPYYVDFAGIDDDGDSLVYSLTTPLNTSTADALPPVSAGPYLPVIWRPGYSLNNIINGQPDLRISREGLLIATPRTQGLFVFAVKIDEFRAGQKIGESRRDFQMLVVDACPQAEPPAITGKKLTDAAFTFSDNMSVSFSNVVTDANRCIDVRISDPDASKISDNFSERVSIRVVPLNFRKDINSILPATTTTVLTNGSTHDFRICFPQCPFINGPYQIGVIAFDDACSLPLTDTLKVIVNTQPPTNTAPYFVKPTQPITQVTLLEGGVYEAEFEVRDNDGDELIPFITTDGFILADAGFTVSFDEPRVNGKLTGKIRWDAFCNIFDFTNRTFFEVKILANDRDICDNNALVSVSYKFQVVLPGNADPIIDTDLTANPQERTVFNIQRRINESLAFNVTGTDLVDNDFLTLDVLRRDSMEYYGASFTAKSGNRNLTSQFTWDLRCAKIDLSKRSTFVFTFIVADAANKCRFYKADTVDVQVKVLPPINTGPLLVIQKQNQTVNDQTLAYESGNTISLTLTGTDADLLPEPDLLSLQLIEASGNVQPEGYEFTPAQGIGPIQTTFTWNPDCSVFREGVYENDYVFIFRVSDNRCFNTKADTVTVNIKLRDIVGYEREFFPPNVFTPNNDGHNDYFAVEGIDPFSSNPDPDATVAFPPDNCQGQFESVKIFNRWGNPVFESRERSFRWYAPNQPAGVYYYVIKFSHKEYRGSLSVRI
ncbi:MAG TPA: gliding motility-associated C-terminal domain-containing protein [Cyclobacteriaceae bacterium]|nr:gliding motility-associated C-terminal domain-containing protein [Cyclobacteriaceae bacterium]